VAEAFGLVLIEAMACGLPVIAADAHGPAEILAEGTGWLVPPDDQEALAGALLTAAADPDERRRRGARAYGHSRASYSWPSIAAQIAALFDEVSSRRRPGGRPAGPAVPSRP
jgi:glycosyltransferase involved in cell wall biosynthesis